MTQKAGRVGVNYTASRHFPLIKELIDSGSVDYVEILIDNFLTVPAQSILEKFDHIPIAFHIMNSRFFETDDRRLAEVAAPLRSLIREIKPLYVSDHVGCFTHNSCVMPVLGEYDYQKVGHAVASIDRWQELLGTRIILENFPSYTPDGIDQPNFFETVLHRTGAGLLFDISNAIVAEHNAQVAPGAWDDLVESCCHFHAGGYSESSQPPLMLLDTHDRKLSDATNTAIAGILSERRSETPTITIEFDRNIQMETWKAELQRISRLGLQTSVSEQVL